MKPVLFSIGDVNIYSYGLMYAIALIAGLLSAEYRAKKHGLDKDFTFNLGFGCIIFGVIGAKLFYLLTITDRLALDFWGTISRTLTSGFVVYGGIIIGVLFGLVYCKRKKKDFWDYLDIAVFSIALGQAIGRIGCFLGGCCHGIATDAWYGIAFPEGAAEAPAGIPVIPTQLISSALNLINAAVLLIAYRRFKQKGCTSALYMINYGTGRFLIEFIRDDYRGNIGFLSTSQFISVFVILLGVILMIVFCKKGKNKDRSDNSTDRDRENKQDGDLREDESEDELISEAESVLISEEDS